MNPKRPAGPPVTLGNMYENGVRHLMAFCHNDACRHQAVIDVSIYRPDTPIPGFRPRVKCGKCGGKRVDVRPNWREEPGAPDDWESRPAWPK
jgi:hypothetical protein